jgi:PPOX class probable F420-dependent enzyme
VEWKEALPLLQQNHTGVAISVTPKGRAQSTVVGAAVLDGKIGFSSRSHTVKLKNIERTGRATVTVIKLDTRRYVTVEGPASIEPWQDTPAHIKRLKDLYTALGRAPKGTDEEFAAQMRDEKRSLVLVTPERLYGSLGRGG